MGRPMLADRQLADRRMVPTGGRSAQWWWAIEHFANATGGTEEDRSVPSDGGVDPFGPLPSSSATSEEGHADVDEYPARFQRRQAEGAWGLGDEGAT
jgi:hypothetical protein